MSAMNESIQVHKLDASGVEVWRYEGVVLEQSAQHVILEAFFDREQVELPGMILQRGDRFVEYFYADRWYNVFAIYDSQKSQRKGWYCNLSRPARIEPGHVYTEDLALDLLVYNDGRWRVLDEDEFQALQLSSKERAQAQRALQELQRLAKARQGPFG